MNKGRLSKRFLKPCRRCDELFRPKSTSGRLCKSCVSKALAAGQKKAKESNRVRHELLVKKANI